MKFVLMVFGVLLSQSVFASGSLDYLCAARDSNVRYHYTDGDGRVEASVYRVAGVNYLELFELLVTQNLLTLDAFQVDGVLKRGASIDVDNGCYKLYYAGQENPNFAKCMARPGAIELVNSEGVEVDPEWKEHKNYHVRQSFKLSDGSQVALHMWSYSEKDMDGDMSGTLTIRSSRAEFKDLGTLKVSCTINTP